MAPTQRQAQTVNPNVDVDPDAQNEVATMDGVHGIFAGEATVVDEVVERPLASDEPEGGWWVIRPNENIEHMTVGTVDNSYQFQAGTRYKVPFEVMSILAHREYLSERPYQMT